MELLIYMLFIAPAVASLFYRRGVEYATLASSVATILVSAALYFELPIGGPFYVERLTWYFIVMVACIYFGASVYSLGYLAQAHLKYGRSLYYVLLNLFSISMFFTLVVDNLGLMWVGLEATTVSSVLLVSIEQSEAATEAAWRYVVVVSTGVTLAFMSVIFVYYSVGNLSLGVKAAPSLALNLAVAIGLIGFGTKSGVFPVNTWLPDAHSEAPAPVSAMFSGVLLPVALYVLYRLFQLDPLVELYSWSAVVSLLVASLMMVSQSNYKRLFAYSTIENINIALLGFVLGQPIGAVILLVAHAFGKTAAFFSSGTLYRLTGEKKIRGYGIWRLKYLPYSMMLSSLSVTGAPPFANFIGEFLILYSVLHYSVWQFVIVVFAMGVSFVAMNRHVSKMVFQGDVELGSEGRLMGTTSLAMAVAPLVIGVFLLLWWWMV